MVEEEEEVVEEEEEGEGEEEVGEVYTYMYIYKPMCYSICTVHRRTACGLDLTSLRLVYSSMGNIISCYSEREREGGGRE